MSGLSDLQDAALFASRALTCAGAMSLLSLGCSPDPLDVGGPENTHKAQQRMNGAICSGPDFDPVGDIRDGTLHRCTGVRIACGVFLSAAHCELPNPPNSNAPTSFTDAANHNTKILDGVMIPNAY